jgi:hypothetical protein
MQGSPFGGLSFFVPEKRSVSDHFEPKHPNVVDLPEKEVMTPEL